MSGEAIKKLHGVIREHWCDEFEHGESCKHCTLEFKICIPLLKLMYPEFDEEAREREREARGIKKSTWKELWENQEKIEIRGNRFNETWLGRVKLEGDNLKNKADLFDSNLILINQFAILKGKHYWRGDELEEMKDKAEKWDEWWAKEGEHLIEGQLMARKLKDIEDWFKPKLVVAEVHEFFPVRVKHLDELKKILEAKK